MHICLQMCARGIVDEFVVCKAIVVLNGFSCTCILLKFIVKVNRKFEVRSFKRHDVLYIDKVVLLKVCFLVIVILCSSNLYAYISLVLAVV